MITVDNSPSEVTATQVQCTSGDILDLRDGRLLEGVEPEAPISQRHDDISMQLYDGETISAGEETDRMITRTKPGDKYKMSSHNLKLYGLDGDGQCDWKFDLTELGYSSFYNYYTYRFHSGYIYFLGKEGDYHLPEVNGESLVSRSAPFHFVALDAVTGKVVQDIVLPDEAKEYRIECVVRDGILLSHANNCLALHRFAQSKEE